MGWIAALAKLRKSRHFQTKSRAMCTDRPSEVPGPGPHVGCIPLRVSQPTSLRSGSPFLPSLVWFESRVRETWVHIHEDLCLILIISCVVGTIKFDVWASAISFWGQAEVSWGHPSDPTRLRRLGRGDDESSSSVKSLHVHSDHTVFGVKLPSTMSRHLPPHRLHPPEFRQLRWIQSAVQRQ